MVGFLIYFTISTINISMRKQILISLFILTSCAGFAQGFFEVTSFVGALSDDPAKDWTQGWTNFDPKNTAYPAPNDVTTLDATTSDAGHKHITGNITIGGVGVVYLLKGIITIDSSASLTINAGTFIRGEGDILTGNYALVNVHRGGKILY